MIIFLVSLVLAASLSSTVKGSDTRCISKHGHCQDDTISCNGVYQSNLCSGSVSRRCCVPASSGAVTSHALRNSYTLGCPPVSGDNPRALASGLSYVQVDRHGSACSKVNIIPRSTWNARSPKSTNHLDTPVDLFFIHHTEGHACTSISSCSSTMRGIQSWHMNGRGWSDIGYSFLAGDDGNIYEGRGWDRQGAHTQGYNSRSLAVSFMGNYMNHLPPAAAITAVKNLIACGIESGKITSNYRLYGHRDAGSTSCPGNALYALIQTWPHYSTVKL